MNDNIYLSVVLKDDIKIDNLKYPSFVKRDESKKAYSLLFRMFKYLGISIDINDICCSSNGKPYIKNSNIYFNYSHSKNYIACAVGFVDVGVDIEDEFEISNKASLLYLPGIKSNFRKAFVTKEAYSKLLGDFDDDFFKNIDVNNINKNKYEISKKEYDLVLFYDESNKNIKKIL